MDGSARKLEHPGTFIVSRSQSDIDTNDCQQADNSVPRSLWIVNNTDVLTSSIAMALSNQCRPEERARAQETPS